MAKFNVELVQISWGFTVMVVRDGKDYLWKIRLLYAQ
jgi:hypothetical protein